MGFVSDSNMMVFSGNANLALAQTIANQLRIPLGKVSVTEFSDSETGVEILENVRGRDIFLIQTTCNPSNHNLMEMLIMVDAFRRASVDRYRSDAVLRLRKAGSSRALRKSGNLGQAGREHDYHCRS